MHVEFKTSIVVDLLYVATELRLLHSRTVRLAIYDQWQGPLYPMVKSDQIQKQAFLPLAATAHGSVNLFSLQRELLIPNLSVSLPNVPSCGSPL